MTWQEAVGRSRYGVAERISRREGDVVLWRRWEDGHADYYFRGRTEPASLSQVEGYLDWEPVAP